MQLQEFNRQTVPTCFGKTKYNDFYKSYSEIMFIGYGIFIFILFITFSSSKFSIFKLIVLTVDTALFIMMGISIHKFRKTGNYGTPFAYCLALTMYLLSQIMLIVGLVGFFMLEVIITFWVQGPRESFDLKLTIIQCVLMLLIGYSVFLNRLYFKVVKERRKFELEKKMDFKETNNEMVNSALLNKDKEV